MDRMLQGISKKVYLHPSTFLTHKRVKSTAIYRSKAKRANQRIQVLQTPINKLLKISSKNKIFYKEI